MKRNALALVLLTSCLAVSGCKPETLRSAEALRPDLTNPERFVCEAAGTRPVIPPEYVIDWTQVTTVAQARAEHEAFVTRLRQRETGVTGYLVQLEGKHFVCFNNMAWQVEFYAGLDAEQ